jgi:hypothetical protein
MLHNQRRKCKGENYGDSNIYMQEILQAGHIDERGRTRIKIRIQSASIGGETPASSRLSCE